MSQLTPPASTFDTKLRFLREGIAALIALSVVVASLVLLFLTLHLAGGSADVFQQGKDLLLFINPLLGVVLGYYFNKVTTEARAESAEATAREATTVAQVATTSREVAEKGAQQAQNKTEEVTRALADLSDASERFLAGPAAPIPGALSSNGGSASPDETRDQMQRALARARRHLG